MLSDGNELNGLAYSTLDSSNWDDFETVMGKNGAFWGCWCAYDRMRRVSFSKTGSEDHKSVTRQFVDSGKQVGIIAYKNKEPVGWCSAGPVGEFPGIMHSRVLKPENPEGKWCITCLFIRRNWRKMGLTTYIIMSAMDVARRSEARSIEAYPMESGKAYGDASIYRGILSMYLKLGFISVRSRTKTGLPIVEFKFQG